VVRIAAGVAAGIYFTARTGYLVEMKLARGSRDVFQLTVTALELPSLVAAVRIAADVLAADPRTPPEATARLRTLLADYERAAASLGKAD
jgi:hypothetical protein